MRRFVSLFAAFAIIMAGGAITAIAQSASPDGASSSRALADLGYPELRVRVTPDGVEAPDDVPAGRVLLVIENTDDALAFVSAIKMVEGESMEDLLAAAEPETRDGSGILPELQDVTWAGGDYAPPGETSTGVVLDLTPGTWYAYDAAGADQTPPSFTVTGDYAPDNGEILGTAAFIEMVDFQFIVPDGIKAGTQIWKVTNSGEQLHDIHVLRAPDGTTPDEILQALFPTEEATAEPGMLDPNEDIVSQFGIGTISTGQTVWKEITIEPGTYVVATWASEELTGTPQLALGMLSVFTVPEPGHDAPPPASPEPIAPRAMVEDTFSGS